MDELDSSVLFEIRKKALRRNVWFKVLTRAERAILSLAPMCTKIIRSPKLIDIIAKLIVKIEEALNNPLRRFKSQVGEPMARRISHIAQSWGYKDAEKWANDRGFIQYLAIMKFQDASGSSWP